MRDAFAHPGPALIDVVTDPLALSLPPTITGEQVKGFALAMSKLVMNEGVGEAVKMAKSNIRNVPRLPSSDPDRLLEGVAWVVSAASGSIER